MTDLLDQSSLLELVAVGETADELSLAMPTHRASLGCASIPLKGSLA